ncbi:transglycosylase SLT domain-containing protein [Schwartzia succinivorans]|uniref:transglycosylase SLT domain-containing protein n=1 Tax=Schwartzia succinivorans TaxID=55507 RepID=UPI00235621D2|nr:transglycosylase SLT domain-containing protein [Schwartzia succinivorans]
MKKILLVLLLYSLIFIPSAFAMPPFAGGEVTSPYGEDEHFGHVHMGIDIGTESGTYIKAPFNGIVENGAGNGYIYWVSIRNVATGEELFFGDCSADTLNMPTGYVSEGTIIGYTGGDYYDGPLGFSTGPHTHVEYWPQGEGSYADPAPYLQSLGVDLSGNVVSEGGHGGGSGGSFRQGADNIALPWGVESMYRLGESVNKLIKDFVDAISKGYSAILSLSLGLLALLCIIDLCVPLVLTGECSIPQMAEKIVKYGFLFFVCASWQMLVNDFFLDFVISVSGTFVADADIISSNISQPQFILQKCVFLLTPGLNKIAAMGSMDFLNNLGYAVIILLVTFIVILAYFLVTLFIMLVYIDFYISAILHLVVLPFQAWTHTKFVAEGTLGHFTTATFQLLIVSIMVGFTVFAMKDVEAPANIFSVTSPAVTATGGGGAITGAPEYVALAKEAAARYKVPENIFLAQIQLESNWNPRAVSSAGALGIAQFMPETAAGWGIDPFDVEQALDASAHYMSNLYEVFGDWNYALAAYNGGQYSIDKNEPLPGWAMDYVKGVHQYISGSYVVKNEITADQFAKFLSFCLSLIVMAALMFIVPKSIMKHLGGRFELQQ